MWFSYIFILKYNILKICIFSVLKSTNKNLLVLTIKKKKITKNNACWYDDGCHIFKSYVFRIKLKLNPLTAI